MSMSNVSISQRSFSSWQANTSMIYMYIVTIRNNNPSAWTSDVQFNCCDFQPLSTWVVTKLAGDSCAIPSWAVVLKPGEATSFIYIQALIPARFSLFNVTLNSANPTPPSAPLAPGPNVPPSSPPPEAAICSSPATTILGGVTITSVTFDSWIQNGTVVSLYQVTLSNNNVDREARDVQLRCCGLIPSGVWNIDIYSNYTCMLPTYAHVLSPGQKFIFAYIQAGGPAAISFLRFRSVAATPDIIPPEILFEAIPLSPPPPLILSPQPSVPPPPTLPPSHPPPSPPPPNRSCPARNFCSRQATCTPSTRWLGYTCRCLPGYVGNGLFCSDACCWRAFFPGCPPNSNCVNYFNSTNYIATTGCNCRPGYVPVYDAITGKLKTCRGSTTVRRLLSFDS